MSLVLVNTFAQLFSVITPQYFVIFNVLHHVPHVVIVAMLQSTGEIGRLYRLAGPNSV